METLLHVGLSNALAAALLALPAAAVTWYGRRPALAHSLWLLVLLKLLTPPLFPLHLAPVLAETAPRESPAPQAASAEPAGASSVLVFTVPEGEAASEEVPVTADAGLPEEDSADTPLSPAEASSPSVAEALAQPLAVVQALDWRWVLGGIWAVGSLLWLALAFVRALRFRRLLRYATPAPECFRLQAEQMAARVGLHSCPGVWMVPGRLSPMVWMLGGPARLLLPQGLWGRLSREQRGALLLHELAHLRRRDHWVRLLELLVSALYWWHPAVWWARRELRQAEEECCDAWVVWALPGRARAYAEALLATLDYLAGSPAALPTGASGIGHIRDLKRRLTMIMNATTPRSLTWRGALGVTCLAAVLLPVLPTWAQEPPIRLRLVSEDTTGAKEDDKKPEVDQLHSEIEKLTAELRAARAQFDAAQKRMEASQRALERARARLGQLGGSAPAAEARPIYQSKTVRVETRTAEGEKGKQRIVIVIQDADGKMRTIEVPQEGNVVVPQILHGNLKVEPVPPTPAKVPPLPVAPGRPAPTPAPAVAPPAPGALPATPRTPPAVRRSGDMERRLDDLIREIEQLKKEIRQQRGDGSGESTLYYRVAPAAPPVLLPWTASPAPPPPAEIVGH